MKHKTKFFLLSCIVLLFSCHTKSEYVNDNGEKIKTVYEDSMMFITRIPVLKKDSILLSYIITHKRDFLLNNYNLVDFRDSIHQPYDAATFFLNRTAKSRKQYLLAFKSLPLSQRNFVKSDILEFGYSHFIKNPGLSDALTISANLKLIINGDTVNKVFTDKIMRQ